ARARQSARAQAGVSYLAQATQPRLAPSACLRVELGGLGRVLLALDLDVGVLGARRWQLFERVRSGCVLFCRHLAPVYEERRAARVRTARDQRARATWSCREPSA